MSLSNRYIIRLERKCLLWSALMDILVLKPSRTLHLSFDVRFTPETGAVGSEANFQDKNSLRNQLLHSRQSKKSDFRRNANCWLRCYLQSNIFQLYYMNLSAKGGVELSARLLTILCAGTETRWAFQMQIQSRRSDTPNAKGSTGSEGTGGVMHRIYVRKKCKIWDRNEERIGQNRKDRK